MVPGEELAFVRRTGLRRLYDFLLRGYICQPIDHHFFQWKLGIVLRTPRTGCDLGFRFHRVIIYTFVI